MPCCLTEDYIDFFMGKNKVKSQGRTSTRQTATSAVPFDEHTPLLSQQKHALDRLYDHFINEKHGDPIPFGFLEGSLAAVEGIGGSGGIYLLPIVDAFTKKMPPALAWSFKLTNPLSNVLFLINAANELADTVVREVRSPVQLNEILNRPNKKSLAIKYFKMGSGALVCAVPFGAATYLFPLSGCESSLCLGATITHTVISNTVLHAIAWDILLKPENWVYRLPTLPLEKAYGYFQRSRLTDDERKALSLRKEKEVIYQKYRQIVAGSFNQAAQRIVQDYITSKSPTQLRSIGSATSSSSISMFVDGNVYPATESRHSQQSNHFFRNYLILFLGAILTIIAGTGWVANPIFIGVQEGLSLSTSVLIGILPSYSTAVLFAFYGAMVSGQIHDYLTIWNGVRSKFSLEAQLYPKTFAAFLLVNLYVAAFAFAGAEQLIRTVLGDDMWDDVRPYFENASIPVFQLLSFVPLLNLFNTFIRKSVAKFGAEGDHKLAARLLEKTHVLLAHLAQLDGEKLISSLSEFDEQQLRSLGIRPDDFSIDVEKLERLKQPFIGLVVDATSIS